MAEEMAAQEKLLGIQSPRDGASSPEPANVAPRFVSGCIDLLVPGALHESSLRLGGSSRFIFDRTILPPLNKYLGVQKRQRKRRFATKMHVAPVDSDSAATQNPAATLRETRKARFHESAVGRWAMSFSDAYEQDGSVLSASACLGIEARPSSPPTDGDYRNNPSFVRRAAEARFEPECRMIAASIDDRRLDAARSSRQERPLIAPVIEELVSKSAYYYRRASSEVVMRGLNLRANNTLPTAMSFYLTMDTQIRNMHIMQTLYAVEVMRAALARASEVTGAEPGERIAAALRIGVVGCGRIGRGIVAKLLSIGCDPRSICVMSRSTEPAVERLIARGVQHCLPEHCASIARCQLLILCCLPLHLCVISNLLRPHLTDKSLICSLVVGCSAGRLKRLFHTNNIIRSLVSVESLQKRGIRHRRRGTMRRKGRRTSLMQKQMWVGGAAKKASQRHSEKLARIEAARDERQQRENLAKKKHDTFHSMRVPREQLVSYTSAALVNFEQHEAHTHITCFIAAVMKCMLANFKLLKPREAEELTRSIILGPTHAKPTTLKAKVSIRPQQDRGPKKKKKTLWTEVRLRRPSTLGRLREDGSLPNVEVSPPPNLKRRASLTVKVSSYVEVPMTTKVEQCGFREQFAIIAGTFFEQTYPREEGKLIS